MISSNWAKKRVEAAPPKKDMKKGAACRSAAGKDGVGEIYTVLVFGWNLRYVHRPGGGLGKIEDEETGEYLLEDEVRLLCVKMDEADGSIDH